MAVYNGFKTVITKICKATSVLSMIVVFLISFVLVVDIILRLTTEKLAVTGSYELTEMSMIIIVFLGIAITQVDKDHVRVTMFIEFLPYRVRMIINTLTYAFTTVLCAIIFYASVLQAIGETKSGITTAVLYIPIGPFAWVMMAGMLLLTLVLLIDTIDSLISAIENKPPQKAESEGIIC